MFSANHFPFLFVLLFSVQYVMNLMMRISPHAVTYPNMATRFIFSSHFLCLPSKFLSLNSPSLYLLHSAAVSAAISTDQPIPYGPSLHKGHILNSPFAEDKGGGVVLDDRDDHLFDETSFTRVFHLAALRVPSSDCFALESRFRGHLLNWPRIRNIARVPGDDLEHDFITLLPGSHNSDAPDDDHHHADFLALNRRIYGKAEGDGEPLTPVLYRDKLARTFNARGFVNFRNLAKLSRPKKRKDHGDGRGTKMNTENKGVRRNDLASVQLIEEGGQEGGQDLSGLLGDGFKTNMWKGSTRLLLLDERYASKPMDELPEAIKAVLNEGRRDESTILEIVRCKLTLFYNYWQANEILEVMLPKGMVIPSAFETVGHIAHLNLKDEHLPYKKIIAKVLLDKTKPMIQSVVNKVEAIHNDYRTMQLEVLAGNHSLVTTVVENGLRFHVDLATVYWNTRLGTERQRLLQCFTRDDVVCDVFAGVGPISISAAKKVKYVYANDLNPYAVEYLERNCFLNKVERKVQVFNMDGRRFIDALFKNESLKGITQVVMNLPSDAAEYLDVFKGIYREKGKDEKMTYPRIHVYGFSKAEDPEFEFEERIRIALSDVSFSVEMRRIRLVAPGKWMLCASFILPESVAFGGKAANSYDY